MGMNAAAVGIALCQQGAGEGCRQGQYHEGIAHRPARNFGLPAGQRPGLGMLFVATLPGLEDHTGCSWADDSIRQHERIPGPTHLQGAMHPPLGVFPLQVGRQLLAGLERIQFHPHRQQFTAQLISRSAQQFHGHGPFPPLAQAILESQQPAKVVLLAIEGHSLDMER